MEIHRHSPIHLHGAVTATTLLLLQEVKHSFLIAETRIQSLITSCAIRGGQKWYWSKFLRVSLANHITIALHSSITAL
jgi:hypothetical protein